MNAIANIRRDLREASYMRHAAQPFAGPVHDFRKPLRERLARRAYTGPYYWTPTVPGKGRGFYQSQYGLACDQSGSTFDLRLDEANSFLGDSRLRFIRGYHCDQYGDSTLRPIIARLPHGRGFLAGWTMGAGMAACIDPYIYEDAEDAARAAHDLAEHDADAERNRQQYEDEAC